jgi:hypothetical protein
VEQGVVSATAPSFIELKKQNSETREKLCGGRNMSRKNEENTDLFDRGFFGKSGCMIILIVAVIAFFTIKNLF